MPRSIQDNIKLKKQREKDILDVSLALFVEKGFNLVTTDDICNKLNMSHGLFYHYFKNKEELLLALSKNAKALLPDIDKKEDGYVAIKHIMTYWKEKLLENTQWYKYFKIYAMDDIRKFPSEMPQNLMRSRIEKIVCNYILKGQDTATINSANFTDLCKCMFAMFSSFVNERVTKTPENMSIPDVDVMMNLFDKKEVYIV